MNMYRFRWYIDCTIIIIIELQCGNYYSDMNGTCIHKLSLKCIQESMADAYACIQESMTTPYINSSNTSYIRNKLSV